MVRFTTRLLLFAWVLLSATGAQAKQLSVVSEQLSVEKHRQDHLLLAKKDKKDGRWENMSKKDREKLQKRREKYESMSPEEKARIRRARERYEKLPPQQRKKLRKKWEDMTPEERRRYRLEERKYR